MVGFPTDKNTLDARAGNIAIQVRDSLDAASRLKAWLDTKTEADLVALGYTSAEVAVIKSAFTDLAALRSVATAGQTVPAVNNFLFWSAQLCGVN
ncbi:MAG TPA: hypothetical protein PKJ32_07045 [Piscinibacter sp.]|nr:hypothetical protein [Piscinibacter sp.]HPV80394.1 hypothetical protein [Dermatophilaceae bacterium]